MTSSAPSTAAWSLDAEAASLGQAYAAANLRLDLHAPTAFIDAFKAYRGPKGRVDNYFAKKLLGLRLNAIKRGFVIDKEVTAEALGDITFDFCLVSLEPFSFSGQNPANASVDRIINEGTYALGNLAMFTQRVNRAKGEKTFEDVLEIVETGEDTGGLTSTEWLRLLSLMYGAWNAYSGGGDNYLIPWCTFSGPNTIKTTSQVVQMFLLDACAHGQWPACLDVWRDVCIVAGEPPELLVDFMELLHAAVQDIDHMPQAWLAPGVYDGFVEWYNKCRPVIAEKMEQIRLKVDKDIDIYAMVDRWTITARKLH